LKRFCCQCENHIIINDADPKDIETVNDVAVLCKLVENDYILPNSRFPSERSEYRAVTVACSPDNIKEALPLEWCPIPEEEFKQIEIPTLKKQRKKRETKQNTSFSNIPDVVKKVEKAVIPIIHEEIKIGRVVG